jgi:hypothetical protein
VAATTFPSARLTIRAWWLQRQREDIAAETRTRAE